VTSIRSTDHRIRRPAEREDVFRQLISEGPFDTLRDAMLFAAALGRARSHSIPFTQSAEPIRWDTMTARPGTESVVNMLAVTDSDDDAEVVDRAMIMSEERFDERAKIFEEYANGGLEIIGSELKRSPESPNSVIVKLILSTLDEEPADDVPALDKLVNDLGL